MPDYPLIRWETEGGATLPADDNGAVRVPTHHLDEAEPQSSVDDVALRHYERRRDTAAEPTCLHPS
jgi:hypothetical protein